MRCVSILGAAALCVLTSGCDSKRDKCEKLSRNANQAMSGLLAVYEQQNREKGTFVDACAGDPAMTDEVLKCFLDADGILSVAACTLQMNRAAK